MIIKKNRLKSDSIGDAFSGPLHNYKKLEKQFYDSEIEIYEYIWDNESYTIQTIVPDSLDWIKAHRLANSTNEQETDNHVKLKIMSSLFLESKGYEVDKCDVMSREQMYKDIKGKFGIEINDIYDVQKYIEVRKYMRSKCALTVPSNMLKLYPDNYVFTGFEVGCYYGIADVSCKDSNVYAECGNTPPERITKAHLSKDIEKVVVAPYGNSINNDRYKFYEFIL